MEMDILSFHRIHRDGMIMKVVEMYRNVSHPDFRSFYPQGSSWHIILPPAAIHARFGDLFLQRY
jgi:hypothetical protein